MSKMILGRKIGMTQIIENDGNVVPVTAIKTEACVVVGVKTIEKDGYNAYVLGFETVKEKKLTKPRLGLFLKNEIDPKRVLKECRLSKPCELTVGQSISLGDFEESSNVEIKSRSIGKGFAGTIKRHNFSRGPMSHGSKNKRRPGSIGGGTEPGRVFKGTKMGGHMGNENITLKKLKIVRIDSNSGMIYIKGSVPGKKGNLVQVISNN